MAEGLKNDMGKPPLSLISREANLREAEVLAFGARKYSTWNWSKGIEWSRVLDAALRHIAAYADGENFDEESGLNHLAHARCCISFLLDFAKEHPELDDRRPRPDLVPARRDSTKDVPRPNKDLPKVRKHAA